MPKTEALRPIKAGRPRAARNHGRPHYFQGKLYPLLIKTFPEYVEDGQLRVEKLASALKKPDGRGMHKFTLYQWMQNDRIPKAAGAKALIALSNGRLTEKTLAPFVFA